MKLKLTKNQKPFNKSKTTVILAVVSVLLFSVIGSGLYQFNNKNSSKPNAKASAQEPADINNDNKVDIFDLSILISKWNTTDSASDINKDGTVNIFDLSILISKWGTVVGGGAVGSNVPGWQINASNVGLAPFGLNCNSLPLYTGPDWVPANTTIYRKRIPFTINVSAGNVTIEQSCVQPADEGSVSTIVDPRNFNTCGSGDNSCILPHGGLVIKDSEIDASLMSAQNIAGACAVSGTGTLVRNYIHGMGSGICFFGTGLIENGLAQQNYVTGLRSYGDSHNEAATVRDFVRNAGDTRKVEFIGNRLNIESGNISAVLFLQPTWEDISNVLVTNNYLEGGGWVLYSSGGQTGAHIYNANAINNRFRSTGWGPAVVDNVEGWNTWQENYIYNSNNPDGKGSPVAKP